MQHVMFPKKLLCPVPPARSPYALQRVLVIVRCIRKCQKQLLRDWPVREKVAEGQWWSDAAEYISEGVHGGSHLARHHCSGEQLVQLNQFVGCGVKLERNAVQRVPRFHLDHKTRERTQNHTPGSVQGISLKLYREDVTQMMRDGERETDREREREKLKNRNQCLIFAC